jgi:sirohydrochlorin ferrochelatase
MAATRILLVDNGALRPEATLALRRLSEEVGQLLSQPVLPVSVLHSHKIDPTLLGGKPAVIFEQAVQAAKQDGVEELIVLPLFIGHSLALTEYLPKVFAEAKAGKMKLRIREPLFDPSDLAELPGILIDNLQSTGWTKGSGTVFLCDHGSPVPNVTMCRNTLAAVLRKELGLKAEELIACSMERREGPEYDFNEPLLADALKQAKGDVVILMLFLLPGRHAGPGGDVATIAKEHAPAGVPCKLSPLLGTHPHLPALLEQRCRFGPRLQTAKRVGIVALLLSFALAIVMKSHLPPSLQNLFGFLLVQVGVIAGVVALAFLYLRSKYRNKS